MTARRSKGVRPAALTAPAPISAAQLDRIETGLAWLITAIALVLLAVMVVSGPGLWRDEVSSVNTQLSPSLGEMWTRAEFESFPVGWMLLLRLWLAIAGSSDTALRMFGGLGAISLIAAVWFAARQFGVRAPAIGLCLLVLNPEILRWAATIRPWGIGAAAGIAAVPFIVRAATTPTRGHVIAAGVAATVCVQFLFQNAIVVAAAIAGCLVIVWREAGPRRAFMLFGIGLTAALTLLPYAGIIRRRSAWNAVGSAPVEIQDLLRKIVDVLGAAGTLSSLAWIAMLSVIVVAAFRSARLASGLRQEGDNSLVVAATTAAMAAGLLGLYLALSYPTQSWYYLGLIAMAAVCAQVAASTLRSWAGRVFRIAVAAAVLVAAVVPATTAAREPYTNIDVVASHLNAAVHPDDFIVVGPWFLGVPFARYYQGAAPFETVPAVADHSISRYDLLKAQMLVPDPMAPIRERIQRTLQSGRQVWYVGLFETPPSGLTEADLTLPPPPLPKRGWSSAPYEGLWAFQAGLFLTQNAATNDPVVIPAGGRHESADLRRFSGWRVQGSAGK